MKRTIRSPSGSVLVVLTLLSTGVWLCSEQEALGMALSETSESAAGASFTPVNEVERSAVLGLMTELKLDPEALAALNVTEGQAITIVAACRTWQAENKNLLENARVGMVQKATQVDQVEKAISMGTADASRSSTLASARQEVETSEAAYRSALAPLEAVVNGLLSESQRTTWSYVKVGHGQTMPVRMLNLSDSQRIAIAEAQNRRQRTKAQVKDAAARANWDAGAKSEVDQILTAEQRESVRAYQSYVNSATSAVAKAVETVLRTSTD